MDEREAMQQAIACARSVEGRTSPRPPVGAVLVRDNVVVGKGATSPPYGPHAEVHALNEAGARAYGADLYTTLEPCCVTIHTPPCTRAIIDAGVRRVIVGTLDPNPLVSGQGVEQLRAAGIEVIVDVEAQETRELIRPFATFITRGRPYVTAKWAMTLDGKLATRTGDAYWISGPEARVWVHNLRDRVDAILVGAGTVRADDPMLNVRLSDEQRFHKRLPRQGPLRVVLATQGQLSDQYKLLQSDLAVGTCIIVGEPCSYEQRQRLSGYGADVIPVALNESGLIDLAEVLQILAHKGIMHVLIEGGSTLLGNAFSLSLIDHVAAFIAPKLVGGTAASSPIGGEGLASMKDARLLQDVRTQVIAGDLLVEGEIMHE